MIRALAALVAVAAALAGCGWQEVPPERGAAWVWITKDRGSQVLAVRSVPAGLTALQALDRVADVETRYGGRFVTSINGIEGSLTSQRDWFYFVNGIEPDRGAAEYRLRPRDITWWDYRSWRVSPRVPVVVGAFPEPFLHGYAGHRRPTVVRYERIELREGARAIGRLLRAESVGPLILPAPEEANVFVVMRPGFGRFIARPRGDDWQPGDPVIFTFGGNAKQLARNPESVRYRYELR